MTRPDWWSPTTSRAGQQMRTVHPYPVIVTGVLASTSLS
jgi:hypothetical protein